MSEHSKFRHGVILTGAVVNIPTQIILWFSLAKSLFAHQWTVGLWGMFGLGFIMCLVTWRLQRQHMKKPGRSGESRAYVRLAFIGVVVASLGNFIDLVIMGCVGVPVQLVDIGLVGICALSVLCLDLITKHLRMTRDLPNRRAIVLGLCTRPEVLMIVGSVAMWYLLMPVPVPALWAITGIGVTFLCIFLAQTPTPANKANRVLYSAYLVSIAVLWAAVRIAGGV